jgi:hypothetical protein
MAGNVRESKGHFDAFKLRTMNLMYILCLHKGRRHESLLQTSTAMISNPIWTLDQALGSSLVHGVDAASASMIRGARRRLPFYAHEGFCLHDWPAHLGRPNAAVVCWSGGSMVQ